MQLPPALEEKFNQLAGRYPVKRSALIPMMLYAQDHFGSLSDELLAEIAKRLDEDEEFIPHDEVVAFFKQKYG